MEHYSLICNNMHCKLHQIMRTRSPLATGMITLYPKSPSGSMLHILAAVQYGCAYPTTHKFDLGGKIDSPTDITY